MTSRHSETYDHDIERYWNHNLLRQDKNAIAGTLVTQLF